MRISVNEIISKIEELWELIETIRNNGYDDDQIVDFDEYLDDYDCEEDY